LKRKLTCLESIYQSTMDKISFCVLLVIAAVSMTDAQEQKSYVGIKGGISIPNLTSGGSQENPLNTGYSSRLGPDFAIYYEKPITKIFSLMPSLEYSSQGGKKNGFQAFPTPDEFAAMFPPGQAPTYLYADFNSEAKMNYLMLGVLAKFTWPLSRSLFSIYADVGPFGALLVSAHQVTSGSSMIYADPGMQQPLTQSPQSFDDTQDIKSDLHKGNLGVQGDLGIALNVTSGRVFLEGGGNYGFINIQNDGADGENHTGAATIRIGYAYRLGK